MFTRRTTLALCLLIMLNFTALVCAQEADIRVSGYVKVDSLFSRYDSGTLGTGSAGRDFYIPGLTPVGGDEEHTQFDMHARQTRIQIDALTELPNGEKIDGVLEVDFLLTPIGNERVSNSYAPRLRHAFIRYRNWTVGQTWSTFQDVSVLPDTLDFVGTPDGAIFARQALIRYRYNNLEVALENPETTLTPFGGGSRIVADDNSFPDAVVRYRHQGDWGHVMLAGMVRELAFAHHQNGQKIDTSETGYGVNLTAKFLFGRDDLRFMAATGKGLGRYFALNTVNAAILDENNELQTIDSHGFGVAYRHFWNEQWRSTLAYSRFEADHPEVMGSESATRSTHSARVNLLYSPWKNTTVGVELSMAQRELEDGQQGDMQRVQFSLKYAF